MRLHLAHLFCLMPSSRWFFPQQLPSHCRALHHRFFVAKPSPATQTPLRKFSFLNGSIAPCTEVFWHLNPFSLKLPVPTSSIYWSSQSRHRPPSRPNHFPFSQPRLHPHFSIYLQVSLGALLPTSTSIDLPWAFTSWTYFLIQSRWDFACFYRLPPGVKVEDLVRLVLQMVQKTVTREFKLKEQL